MSLVAVRIIMPIDSSHEYFYQRSLMVLLFANDSEIFLNKLCNSLSLYKPYHGTYKSTLLFRLKKRHKQRAKKQKKNNDNKGENSDENMVFKW